MQHADSKEEEMHVEKCLGRYVVLLLTVLAFIARPLFGQQPVVTLWPHGAPGSEGKTAQEKVRITPQGEHIVSSVHRPSITVYLPAAGKATGVGVLVIPGGGHSEIWIDHEGYSVAAWLSEHGVAAFVLKYRLAREAGSTYTVDGTELQDAQRAMRLIRSRASEWSVDPQRLGVIGFSAGGELAALVGTRYDAGLPGSVDPIDRESSRPAFQGLIYPSIPQGMNLSKDMPPAFLACGANDRPAVSEGLPELYLTMKRVGMAAELHVFSGQGHGFGVRATNPSNVTDWPDLFYRWLKSSGFVNRQ
ncbi:MAG TPA: alpha/beta hydrolase [Granulicella sp.]|nr:alpha/beta hydrolase [Granulicella sp.]